MEDKSYFQKNRGKILVSVLILTALIFVVFFGCDMFLKNRLPKKYSEFVTKYAEIYGLDEDLVYSIISCESGFNPKTESSAGAIGLMQLMPETAQWIIENKNLSVDASNLTDAETNIQIGCCYFAYLIEKFQNTDNAICAYNGGEGNVTKWLNDETYSKDGKTLYYIPFKETRNYLKKVNTRYEIYKDLYSE